MSVVQALAAMLSAGADASSRLGAASLAANASNANANAALQGDIYRANTQGAIAHRGIDAQNQQAAAEMALRSRLANNQMGLESGRLGLQRRQLGLDSARFGHERDLSLADYGKGPYAPNTGMDDEFKSQFSAANPQEALAMYAKRMLLGNASNPRMMAGMGGLFNTLLQNQQSVDDRASREKLAKDPTVLGMNLAPVVGGMDGMTPEKFGSAMQQILSSFGVGPNPQATAAPGAPPTFTEAQAALPSMTTGPLLSALGIDDKIAPEQFLEKIIPKEVGMWQTHKSPILKDPAAREQLRQYILNRAAIDPGFLTPKQSLFGANADTMASLIKAMLEGGDMQDAARQGYGGGAQSGPRLMPLGY